MSDKILWGKALTGLGNYLKLLTEILGTGTLWVFSVIMVKQPREVDQTVFAETFSTLFFVGLVIYGLSRIWFYILRME